MRKITKQSIKAFLTGVNFDKQNMTVSHDKETRTAYLYLYGHCIARMTGERLYISSAGWQTNTTKERLNGLPGVSVWQQNFSWYYTDENGKTKDMPSKDFVFVGFVTSADVQKWLTYNS